MVAPSFRALTSTPSMAPSSVEDTCPVRLAALWAATSAGQALTSIPARLRQARSDIRRMALPSDFCRSDPSVWSGKISEFPAPVHAPICDVKPCPRRSRHERDQHGARRQGAEKEAHRIPEREDDRIVVQFAASAQEPDAAEPKEEYRRADPKRLRLGEIGGFESAVDQIEHENEDRRGSRGDTEHHQELAVAAPVAPPDHRCGGERVDARDLGISLGEREREKECECEHEKPRRRLDM